MKALSIRQPWAWLIVNGHKTIENRERSIGSYFGPLLIHASKRASKEDWQACYLFVQSNPPLAHLCGHIPLNTELDHGGIVGRVNVVCKLTNGEDFLCPDSLTAAWYTGDVGYYMCDAKPLPFHPCKGQLGFFNVDWPGEQA